MPISVFWSWQTDSPAQSNRRFIREALDAAVAELADGASIVDSPRVESGMENVPGTPDVAQVMFDRIERSDVFIGDVTLVGKIKSLDKGKKGKLSPNPNVMAEMGYAAGRMGWDRVVCVMNERYGSRFKLPFDVQSKRHPVTYEADPAVKDKHEAIKKSLKKDMKAAIKTCLEARHQAAIDAISKLDILCLLVCSIYRNAEFFRDLNQTPEDRDELAKVIDVPGFRSAIQRMLNLSLLYTDAHSQMYSYKWTHRGQMLLKELAKRNQLPAVSESPYPAIDDLHLLDGTPSESAPNPETADSSTGELWKGRS